MFVAISLEVLSFSKSSLSCQGSDLTRPDLNSLQCLQPSSERQRRRLGSKSECDSILALVGVYLNGGWE
jgi:hypothetical protein